VSHKVSQSLGLYPSEACSRCLLHLCSASPGCICLERQVRPQRSLAFMQGISSTMAIASAKVTVEDIITRCLIHLVVFANRQARPQMSLHLCRASLRWICQSATSTPEASAFMQSITSWDLPIGKFYLGCPLHLCRAPGLQLGLRTQQPRCLLAPPTFETKTRSNCIWLLESNMATTFTMNITAKWEHDWDAKCGHCMSLYMHWPSGSVASRYHRPP